MQFLLFILLVYGVSNIVVFNTIPIWERFVNMMQRVSPKYIGKLLTCMICLPTWVGFILSFTFIHLGYWELSPFTSIGIHHEWLAIFFDGCLASGSTWLIHTVQEALERTNND